jgi:hypothetical protein
LSTSAAAIGAASHKLSFVISASAAGTIIEWYDFYLYGVLAAFFSTQFFPKGNDTRPCSRRSRRSVPVLPSARSAPPSSDAWATSPGASSRSSSRSR